MLITIIIIITALFLLYKYSTRNFDYWEKKGIPFVAPLPFIGNFFEVLTQQDTIGDYLAKYYEKFKTPYFGMFVTNTPWLVVRSPDLIKNILVKDFNYFLDRTLLSDEKLDSLTSKFLFVAKSSEWKFMRTKITPAFTSGKIKGMVELINKAAEEMNSYILKHHDQTSLEAKELCAKFSTDVVATCAFGIEAHCFRNENAEFRVIGRKIFSSDWKNVVRQTCYFLTPGIVKLFRMPFFDKSVRDFIREVIESTIANREKTKHKRNDIIDTLIQLKNKSTPNDSFKFEGDRIVAQAGQFYTAGFETVSSTISFTLYELCLQPEIQNKVRAEIKEAISKHGGFTYEAQQEMKYLDMVIYETLRKYPVLPFLDRMCMNDYKDPDSDFVIEKGTPVFIPMFGLHHDPEYFPNPQIYDPERFSEKNKNNIPGYSYIPFGEGPRKCIGERLGLVTSKLGLSHVLSEFEIVRTVDTPVPLVFKTKGVLIAPSNGLRVKFRKIE